MYMKFNLSAKDGRIYYCSYANAIDVILKLNEAYINF